MGASKWAWQRNGCHRYSHATHARLRFLTVDICVGFEHSLTRILARPVSWRTVRAAHRHRSRYSRRSCWHNSQQDLRRTVIDLDAGDWATFDEQQSGRRTRRGCIRGAPPNLMVYRSPEIFVTGDWRSRSLDSLRTDGPTRSSVVLITSDRDMASCMKVAWFVRTLMAGSKTGRKRGV